MIPTGATLAAFVLATAAVLVVPGPSVVYVMSCSLERGRRAGLYAMLGLETGALLHVLAATVGLAALVTSSPAAFEVVKIAGAAYLIHLALHQFRRGATSTAATHRRSLDSTWQVFRAGVLVDLLNPKTAVFFLAFLPPFVDPAAGHPGVQIGLLGLCFVGLAAMCDSTYALLAAGLRTRVRLSRTGQRNVAGATGGVYIALAGLTLVA